MGPEIASIAKKKQKQKQKTDDLNLDEKVSETKLAEILRVQIFSCTV